MRYCCDISIGKSFYHDFILDVVSDSNRDVIHSSILELSELIFEYFYDQYRQGGVVLDVDTFINDIIYDSFKEYTISDEPSYICNDIDLEYLRLYICDNQDFYDDFGHDNFYNFDELYKCDAETMYDIYSSYVDGYMTEIIEMIILNIYNDLGSVLEGRRVNIVSSKYNIIDNESLRFYYELNPC